MQMKKIFEIFKQTDKEIFLVGGSVRDLFLGVDSQDFDFATDATPEEVIKILNLIDAKA